MTSVQGHPMEVDLAPRRARPFGSNRSDLDLDLGDPDRPAAITRVLASCLDGFADRQAAEDAVWQWSVAERLQGLLAVATAGGGPYPPWQMRCDGCAVAVEIDVVPENFAAAPRRDGVVCHVPEGHVVSLRLPRGLDQRAWRESSADAIAMATALIERFDGEVPEREWRVPADWLDALADSLAECDPLTALQFQAPCPGCGHVNVVDFDLEGWLLGRLAVEQQRLLDDVHRLASSYHWSEAEICALPRRRRRAYLARVEREAAS